MVAQDKTTTDMSPVGVFFVARSERIIFASGLIPFLGEVVDLIGGVNVAGRPSRVRPPVARTLGSSLHERASHRNKAGHGSLTPIRWRLASLPAWPIAAVSFRAARGG
jgi:hypothetical protein